jgi:hypothetical protein
VSIFFMVVMVAITSLQTSIGAQTQTWRIDDEYAVYSALIRTKYVTNSTKLVLVFAQTSPNPDDGSPPDRYDLRLRPVAQSTIDAYKTKSKVIRALKDEFDLPVKYTLLKKEELDEMFRQDNFSGWKTLLKKYPEATGIIRVSEVGFNLERTQALVYVEHGCGATCGEGGYVLLSKEGEVWKVQKEVMFMAA